MTVLNMKNGDRTRLVMGLKQGITGRKKSSLRLVTNSKTGRKKSSLRLVMGFKPGREGALCAEWCLSTMVGQHYAQRGASLPWWVYQECT